jgi:predicted CopG family antitoxin
VLEDIDLDQVSISNEVYELFYKITEGLQSFLSILSNTISDQDRKNITDVLSTAGSEHRTNIYSNGFSGDKSPLSILDLKKFLEISLIHIDHSIQSNEREDHLFNAYNLIKFEQNDGISVRYLYEMLEGQVSVLSSKFLKPEKAVVLLRALRSSSLYREDQQSYILYPNRRLPHFVEKNIIPNKLANNSKILKQLMRDKCKDFIEVDIEGKIHFNSQFRNSRILKDALDQLETYSEKDIQTVLDIYEEIFDHQSFHRTIRYLLQV